MRKMLVLASENVHDSILREHFFIFIAIKFIKLQKIVQKYQILAPICILIFLHQYKLLKYKPFCREFNADQEYIYGLGVS